MNRSPSPVAVHVQRRGVGHRGRRVLLSVAVAVLLIAPRVDASEAAAPVAAPAESDPQIEQLREAHTLFESGEWQRAIDEHIHPVIGHFERAFKDSDQALYAAEGMKQAILYSALPHDGKQGVTVLDSTWADAYQLKAYALGELGDVAGARAALKSALALSPMSATYTSELAYTYQSQHDHTQALALYRQAASSRSWPRTRRGTTRTSAVRGAARRSR